MFKLLAQFLEERLPLAQNEEACRKDINVKLIAFDRKGTNREREMRDTGTLFCDDDDRCKRQFRALAQLCDYGDNIAIMRAKGENNGLRCALGERAFKGFCGLDMADHAEMLGKRFVKALGA